MVTKTQGLVDGKKGYVTRRIFTDQELYQQELEQIFGRSWLLVGHDSQVPKPNDFIANYMAEDPILLTRDSKGKLHAFLNMCRHRGNRICRADYGNAPSFMCTYHGWTFATDGKLVGVPGYKEAYFEELDRSQWGLVEAPVETYNGLAFANWDRTAPSLIDYLGDAAWYIDMVVNRREGGAELIGGAHKLVLPINWKFGADNFGGDNYHVPVSHGSNSVDRTRAPQPAGVAGNTGRSGDGMNGDRNRVNVYAGNGHCIIGGYTGETQNMGMMSSSPEAAEYFKEHLPELHSRLGAARGRQGSMGIATIFPNFTWFGISGHLIRMWHPRGPLKTEAWTYCVVDKNAPQSVKDGIRKRLTLAFSPSGTFEQDDMDNFGQSTASGKFMQGRNVPVNVAQGVGHTWTHESIPGLLSPSISEENARGFYSRWAEVMDAPSWRDISIAPRSRSF